jgi:iron complex transport system permease protein
MTSPALSPAARRRRSRRLGLVVGCALLLFAIAASLAIGSRPVPLGVALDALRSFDPRNDLHLVVRELRIPRTIVALLAGTALGVAGAIMQAVTRNPLAEPGLLGINAGAAVAVAVGVLVLGLTSMSQYVWLSFLGAGLAGTAVFILGQAHETGTNPVRLVLAGAGLSVMLASITSMIILNAPVTVLDDFRNWAAGSVEGRGYDVAAILALSVGVGLVTGFSIAGNLNAMALGEDLGRSLGVSRHRTWILACISVMLLAGSATAGAGPIGFVGLVAPQVARAVTGPDYRLILPYSALFAAILLLGADVIGRMIVQPAEIAAGIVAALIGGPFFVLIVRRFRLARL